MIEQEVLELEILLRKLQGRLNAVNTALVNTNRKSDVSTLIHTQGKLHSNIKVAELEIDIAKKQIEIDNILKQYEVEGSNK